MSGAEAEQRLKDLAMLVRVAHEADAIFRRHNWKYSFKGERYVASASRAAIAAMAIYVWDTCPEGGSSSSGHWRVDWPTGGTRRIMLEMGPDESAS